MALPPPVQHIHVWFANKDSASDHFHSLQPHPDAMAFSGPAPEIINGRLAMLGFVAAIGAELTSDEAVAVQWSEAAVPILGTFAIFILASFIPLIKGADPKTESGPFTPAVSFWVWEVSDIHNYTMNCFQLTSCAAQSMPSLSSALVTNKCCTVASVKKSIPMRHLSMVSVKLKLQRRLSLKLNQQKDDSIGKLDK